MPKSQKHTPLVRVYFYIASGILYIIKYLYTGLALVIIIYIGRSHMKSGTLFIVSAPSGAGKTSLIAALLAQDLFKNTLSCVITYTSRSPRPGDVNGKDYHFIQETEFLRLIKKGFFAEWSTAYGTYYGTPLSVLQELTQGHSRVLIVDRAGAQSMLKVVPEAVLIWITPPSIEVLMERLVARGTENTAQIERRMALARQEMEAGAKSPLYCHTIVNNLFENSLDSLKNIVILALDLKKIKGQ